MGIKQSSDESCYPVSLQSSTVALVCNLFQNAIVLRFTVLAGTEEGFRMALPTKRTLTLPAREPVWGIC